MFISNKLPPPPLLLQEFSLVLETSAEAFFQTRLMRTGPGNRASVHVAHFGRHFQTLQGDGAGALAALGARSARHERGTSYIHLTPVRGTSTWTG